MSSASGRTIVVGTGKAAGEMARALEGRLGDALTGLVVTRRGYKKFDCRHIEIVETDHPIPGPEAPAAAQRCLDLVSGLTKDDQVIALISGGGSALWALPAPGVTLDDKRALTRALLKSGATIHEINTVRKHISAIKGGRLALAAWPAHVVTLAISDVAGDDPATIASGPTVPDPTTLADARAVLARYRIEPPPSIAHALADPANETPKPGDPRLARTDYRIVARPRDALDAVAKAARSQGFEVIDLGDRVEGEARDVGRAHGLRALELKKAGKRAILLSGGELTVTIKGQGSGGPNREYALALAIALDGAPGIAALSGDSDGMDGAPDAAGAIVTPTMLARARAAGLDPIAALADNDSGTFFAALGDAVVTGPTHTNVNDIRIVLVDPV